MENTREKVIDAATAVFIQKGFGGARMQEIADEANINKGLLHYYFKSKEKLFHAVVFRVVDKIAPQLDVLINHDLPLKQKISKFIEFYIELLIQNPYLPAFVLSELNINGEKFIQEIISRNQVNPMKLMMQIQLEIQEGNIKPVNPLNLLINVLAMCIFPFIARPILQEISGLNEEEFLKFMNIRKKEVTEFVLSALEV